MKSYHTLRLINHLRITIPQIYAVQAERYIQPNLWFVTDHSATNMKSDFTADCKNAVQISTQLSVIQLSGDLSG